MNPWFLRFGVRYGLNVSSMLCVDAVDNSNVSRVGREDG